MLQEVGFIAGQHEVLAESFAKENYKTVHEEVKKMKEVLKRNVKQYHKHNQDLKTSFKAMSAAKEKFRRAYEEQNKAADAYDFASREGSTSKNEMKKLGIHASIKTSNCDSMKALYADQMLKSNTAQGRFYHDHLPSVLNELQRLEQTRIQILSHSVKKMVAREREVATIISRCHETIEDSFNNVNPAQDTTLVVEKFKTGDIPPSDFKFEDIMDSQSLLKKDTLGDSRPTNLNLYPKKRELEKQIEGANKELAKAEREVESLTKMITACQSHPKYGKPDKFREELQSANQRVQEVERVLRELKAEHTAVERKLETLKEKQGNNSPMMPAIQRNVEARSSSSQSIKSSSLSVGSSSGASSTHSNGRTPTTAANQSDQHLYANPDPVNFRISHDDDWDEEDLPPPPPSQVRADSAQPFSATSSEASSTSTNSMKRCEALYDFTDALDNNIPMATGDQFYVVEDDCDGWTRVRRLMPTASGQDEGYVPSSYLRIL